LVGEGVDRRHFRLPIFDLRFSLITNYIANAKWTRSGFHYSDSRHC
jgi:hypothetical protein